MGSGIFGEFNAMKGLFWECGTVSDMNFVCYYIADSMFNIPTTLLVLQAMICMAFVMLTAGNLHDSDFLPIFIFQWLFWHFSGWNGHVLMNMTSKRKST